MGSWPTLGANAAVGRLTTVAVPSPSCPAARVSTTVMRAAVPNASAPHAAHAGAPPAAGSGSRHTADRAAVKDGKPCGGPPNGNVTARASAVAYAVGTTRRRFLLGYFLYRMRGKLSANSAAYSDASSAEDSLAGSLSDMNSKAGRLQTAFTPSDSVRGKERH